VSLTALDLATIAIGAVAERVTVDPGAGVVVAVARWLPVAAVDVMELNEAFAGSVLAHLRECGIDAEGARMGPK
jgi:acetyl-CoA acetyltransferase